MRPPVITNDQACQHLILHWPDGVIQTLTHHELRLACRCAYCRADRLRASAPPVAQVGIRAVQTQGYGLQLIFSDGHDRGIFPWSYLREMT